MPSKTWKTVADQRRKENFVGRAEQLRIFTENFTSEEPIWMVLSITGEGGVGKSTLLKRYKQEAQRPEINANVVLCDERHYTPVEAMAATAEQLAKLGVESKTFNERYKKYREALQQIESDPSAPRTMVNVVTRGVTDFAIKSLRHTPGIGIAMDYVDEKAAGDALAELAQYTFTRWGNKDEVQLVREPEKILTPLFVDLLNEAAEKKRLMVMLDVFERTAATLSSWLIALFSSDYGEIDLNVAFILSGRDKLEQHWAELAGMMAQVQLEPFSAEETAIYLSNQGIVDETLVRQIHQDTGGLPVLVEFLAGANPQPGRPLPDISERAVERFLWWTNDVDKRKVALLAAIPRQFNKDILTALFNKDATHLFNWLVAQSYVRSETKSGWFYHEKVRELMLRYQNKLSPGELEKSHIILAEYFTQLENELELPVSAVYYSEDWQKYEAERVYHLFYASPEKYWPQVVQAFLTAFHYRWRFAKRLAQLTRQVVDELKQDHLDQDVTGLMRLVIAYEDQDYQQVIQSLDFLSKWAGQNENVLLAFFASRGESYRDLGFYDKALADYEQVLKNDQQNIEVIAEMGDCYLQTNDYEKALDYFNRAIDLDDTYVWAIATRGVIHRIMRRYTASIVDFNRALELDAENASIYAHRGETYSMMGNDDAALADFDRALSLDNKLAWAYVSRGNVYRFLKKLDKAVEDFDQAIALDENKTWTFFYRGLTYHLLKNNLAALADFDQAIALDDKFAVAFAARGEIQRLLENLETALADFSQAIAIDNQLAWVFANRGLVYMACEKYSEAIQDFTRALELDTKNQLAFAQRGEAQFQLKNYNDAIRDLTRAIEIDPQDGSSITRRGDAYRILEQFDDALRDFAIAINFYEPSQWRLSNWIGTFDSEKQCDEIIRLYTRLIEFNGQSAWVFVQRGKVYKSIEEYTLALQDFTYAINLNKDYYEAYLERAEVNWQLGDLDRALGDFSRACELSEWHFGGLISVWVDTYDQTTQQDEIIKFYTRLVELYKKDGWALVQRGEFYQSIQHYDLALQDFSKAIDLDDQDSIALANRGEIYRLMGQFDDAIKEFAHASKVGDAHIEKVIEWIQTFDPITQAAEILKIYSCLIEQNPKDGWALNQRGEFYREENQYELALRDFNAALNLDEENEDALVNRGETYRRMKQFDAAIEDFSHFFDQGRTLRFKIFNWVENDNAPHHYDDSINLLTRWMELKEKDAENGVLLYLRGRIYLLLGRYELALRDINHLIDISQDNSGYYIRGGVYRKMGKLNEALLDFNRSLSDEEWAGLTHANRAAIFILLGDQESAEQAMQKVLSIDNPQAFDHLGLSIVHILANDFPKALAELEAALDNPAIRFVFISDDLLDPLRDLPEFKVLLAKYESETQL